MNNLYNDKKLLNLKRVGIVLRPNSPELKEFYMKISDILTKANFEILLDDKCAKMIGEKGIDFDTMCKESDFLISIGGDGTLISLVRRGFKYNKPILGVNLGQLGFLTDTQPNEFNNMIHNIINGEYRIDSRMLIEGKIDGKEIFAFNDIAIKSANIAQMIHIKASINGDWFNTYYGDGLIISTPTGSTAYNLSLGGPVVYPLTQAFIMTPLSSHSLTQRPLVMSAEFEIELEIDDLNSAIIIVDGQDEYQMGSDSELTIRVSRKKANLIHRVERNYFQILREKLSWGNR